MTKRQRESGLRKLARGFMQPEIIHTPYWEVSANRGETHIVPANVCDDPAHLQTYVEGRIARDEDGQVIADRKVGYLARLSAPGYLDCTEWSAFATQVDAEVYLIETYTD